MKDNGRTMWKKNDDEQATGKAMRHIRVLPVGYLDNNVSSYALVSLKWPFERGPRRSNTQSLQDDDGAGRRWSNYFDAVMHMARWRLTLLHDAVSARCRRNPRLPGQI
ncbi:hypothetical protein ACSS6W_002179 [Trichoderma asperelloides]